jgi:hypothetical protein
MEKRFFKRIKITTLTITNRQALGLCIYNLSFVFTIIIVSWWISERDRIYWKKTLYRFHGKTWEEALKSLIFKLIKTHWTLALWKVVILLEDFMRNPNLNSDLTYRDHIGVKKLKDWIGRYFLFSGFCVGRSLWVWNEDGSALSRCKKWDSVSTFTARERVWGLQLELGVLLLSSEWYENLCPRLSSFFRR